MGSSIPTETMPLEAAMRLSRSPNLLELPSLPIQRESPQIPHPALWETHSQTHKLDPAASPPPKSAAPLE
ncbi:MAG: hypothetical protein AAGE92_03935, partial [Cyanobacteria bacterium P01_G01_bin.4]